MKQYKANSNVVVLASRPQDADAAFLMEARKCGIELYEVSKFNLAEREFDYLAPYFGNKEGYPIASQFQYLVLFGEGEYMVVSEKVFNSMFDEIVLDPASKKLQGKVFWLDAGHGGKDPGAVNTVWSLQEKNAAREICNLLARELRAQGAMCYFSRTDDVFVELSTRAKQANAAKADAFISIHLNSAENAQASGVETLVYSYKGTAYKLAQAIQERIIIATGFKDRGVKERPNLAVLKKTAMPAVLVECGFISNDEEALELFSRATQTEIAEAICAGVVEVMGS